MPWKSPDAAGMTSLTWRPTAISSPILLGVIWRLNQAAARLFNLSQTELVGSPLDTLDSPLGPAANCWPS